MQNDLTTGSVFRNVLSFSLPYLLSYFLQTLYGMADLFIIGQFEGVASTTAVSIGSQVMHMLTVMLVGLAMGATVSIAQAAGGGDKKRTASAIGNTVTLFMLLALALTALLLALRGGIVSIMSTPEEAVQGTLAYLTVCFIGIPFIAAYNIIASIFRGLGDSKSPMCFIAVACVVNIALDYYFMCTLHLGPAGAALGTTLSQAVSVLVSLAVILKRRLISVRRADFRPQRAVMGKLLQIGVPVALQDGFIQVSFVIITIIANCRGLTDAAAVGIVEKIIGFLFLIPSSMLSTVSALGAQAEALVFLGKVGFSVSQEHLNKGSFGQYDGEFLVLDEADRFAGDVIDLPASLCACVRFRGHHAESPAQYRRLMQFIREEGYTAAGFSREITVIDYGFTTDTEKFVTEIMIPLQKV